MADRYLVVAGNWSTTAGWAATSGGATGQSAPGVADRVFLDANSPGNLSMNAVAQSCLAFDCTGFTHTFTHNAALTVAGTVFTLVAGMTYTVSAGLQFTAAAGTILFTTNGQQTKSATVSGGATLSMQDNWTTAATTDTITISTGGLTHNNHNLTCGILTFQQGGNRTWAPGSASITLTGTGVNVFIAGSGGAAFVISANTATITLTGANATFNMNSASLPSGVALTNFTLVMSGGTKTITSVLTPAAVFNAITVTAGTTFRITSGKTVTATNWTLIGTGGSPILAQAGTGGSQTTIATPATVGGISVAHVTFTDVNATVATWWATNSTDNGDNTGITFSAPARTKSLSAGSNVKIARGIARKQSAAEGSNAKIVRAITRKQSLTEGSNVKIVRVLTRNRSLTEGSNVKIARAITRSQSPTQGSNVKIARGIARKQSLTEGSSPSRRRQIARAKSATEGQLIATGARVVARGATAAAGASVSLRGAGTRTTSTRADQGSHVTRTATRHRPTQMSASTPRVIRTPARRFSRSGGQGVTLSTLPACSRILHQNATRDLKVSARRIAIRSQGQSLHVSRVRRFAVSLTPSSAVSAHAVVSRTRALAEASGITRSASGANRRYSFSQRQRLTRVGVGPAGVEHLTDDVNIAGLNAGGLATRVTLSGGVASTYIMNGSIK